MKGHGLMLLPVGVCAERQEGGRDEELVHIFRELRSLRRRIEFEIVEQIEHCDQRQSPFG